MTAGTALLVPVALLACAAWAAEPEALDEPIAPGPFQPTWQSLGAGFKVPAWFREAKIGMWLHWGPQAMGHSGDWFAKFMYVQRGDSTGNHAYANHLARWGHPSVHGYKDVLHEWRAEQWDPEALMALYHRAGARYVLAMGVHHDNFDLWNSQFQPWNSVNVGPKRDILAGWKAAADKRGMKLGVSFHHDYSWWWYQPAFLSDSDGPLQGLPYDAAKGGNGQGTWWQGLSLRDLYGIDLGADVPAGVNRLLDFWHGVPEVVSNQDFARWYCHKWFRRVRDVVDHYSPDFIYFDGNSYPFSGHGTGRGYRSDAFTRIAAHFYNSNLARHDGKLEGMVFAKGWEDPHAVVRASESGWPSEILRDQDWTYENSIGEWFYQDGTFYDPAMVIHALLETVSRDGNFMINVPLTPEGALDPGGRQTLEAMADWIAVNGEAIYGSRAWDRWREGRTTMPGGNLRRSQAVAYQSDDFRFVVGKSGALYAFALAWPTDGKLLVRSLATPAGRVSGVHLLGTTGNLTFRQTDEGLEVTLPAKPACAFAYGLRVTGDGLKPAPLHAAPLRPEADGSLHLRADQAECHGGLRAETRTGEPNLGFWTNPADFATWTFRLPQPGAWSVTVETACPFEGVEFDVACAGQSQVGTAPRTASHDDYLRTTLGALLLPQAGEVTVTVRAHDPAHWQPLNLRGLWLKRLAAAAAPRPSVTTEAEVPPYTLPDPLLCADGRRVVDAAGWRTQRRPELLRLFEQEVYGKTLLGRPAALRFVVRETKPDARGGRATRLRVGVLFEGREDGRQMELLVYLPNAAKGPVPVFLGLNFDGNYTTTDEPDLPLPRHWVNGLYTNLVPEHRAVAAARGLHRAMWPYDAILDHGYGIATAGYGEVEPDLPGHWHDGPRGLAPAPGDGDWGSLGGWAWALSRGLDYLETNPRVDAQRVAVFGFSRLGKAADWAAAQDERFAMLISQESGAGGAALSRRIYGETVGDLVRRLGWWFCPNYARWADNEAACPIDQHELLALVAPRPMLLLSGTEDQWSDPKGEFLGGVGAEAVYRLLGFTGLGTTEWPEAGKLVGERGGYYLRAGKHDVTGEDWGVTVGFAGRWWGR